LRGGWPHGDEGGGVRIIVDIILGYWAEFLRMAVRNAAHFDGGGLIGGIIVAFVER